MRAYRTYRSLSPKRMTRQQEQGCLYLTVVALVLYALCWLWGHPAYLVLLVLGAAAAAAARAWWSQVTRQDLLGRLSAPEHLARLTPAAFEQACAALFEAMGYRATLTAGPGDEGVDILLRRDGREYIVQCKHYPGRTVGSAEVRNLLGAQQDFGAAGAYLLTSGSFTSKARELAARNPHVYLWDGRRIRAEAAIRFAPRAARSVSRSLRPPGRPGGPRS